LYVILLVAAGAWFRMDIWHSLILVQNFFPTEPRPLPVSWSLAMEEYFYVAFPLLMLALHTAGVRGTRLVGWTAIGLIALCSGLRLWNAYGLGPGWTAPFVHENPLLRLDCAAYGTLAAWMSSAVGVKKRVPAPPLIISGLVVAGLTTIAFTWVLAASLDSLVAAGFLRWGPAFLALQTTASDIGFALVVTGLARLRTRMPPALALIVRWISLTSYSIYLTHVPVIGLAAGVSQSSDIARVLAAVGLTAVISTFTYHALERPFLRLRDLVAPDLG
jgi:peptidoglycan/LPS O-acetylase OafA/YrhL